MFRAKGSCMGLLDRFFKKNTDVIEGDVPPEQLPLRNGLCWCGSGLKYKKCHSDPDQIYLSKKREQDLAASKACSPVFG